MPSSEWSFDASTSRTLRFVSHLPPAGIGGSLLLAFGVTAAFVLSNPSILLSGPALLVALLFLIGGPLSLLYLWPMLADPGQRPSAAEFEGGDGFPFSFRSVSTAAVSGAVGLGGLIALGVPFDLLYLLVVGCVFSPLLVAIVTTHGRLEDNTLIINRTEIPIDRLTNVRSIRIRDFAVVWLSYTRRSGVFLPRLAVIPQGDASTVLSTIESGIDADPEIDPPDPAVRAIGIAMGALFLIVAAFAYGTIENSAVRLYLTAAIGGLGAFLCLVGWRGV